jgi:hypothetical protein
MKEKSYQKNKVGLSALLFTDGNLFLSQALSF